MWQCRELNVIHFLFHSFYGCVCLGKRTRKANLFPLVFNLVFHCYLIWCYGKNTSPSGHFILRQQNCQKLVLLYLVLDFIFFHFSSLHHIFTAINLGHFIPYFFLLISSFRHTILQPSQSASTLWVFLSIAMLLSF